MTHADAFLADIIAHPEDDAPRLIYADWLDEHGGAARAEFIRVQCRIFALRREARGLPVCARCGRDTDWHRFTPKCRGPLCSLRRREYETSKRHCAWDWRHGVPGGWHCVYRRGFVAEVSCTLADWLAHGPEIVCRCPAERVTLTDRQPFAHRDGQFSWATFTHLADESLDQSELPPELFSLLGGTHARHGVGGIAFYATAADSLDALSAACLEWAMHALIPG